MKKNDILREANYRYDFDRDLFINRAAKKAFSIEFVDENTQEDLRRLIQENTNGGGWKFYFNVPPTEGAKRELERILG
jgi:thermostable 8-oxoguanine DNA glycosylase